MRVYRVENALGEGPYNCAYSPFREEILLAHENSKKHPTAFKDVPGWKHGQLSAFVSIKQMNKWFKKWAVQLEQEGFMVSVYRVPKRYIRFGSRQVALNPTQMTLLEKRKPTEIIHGKNN